MSTLPGPIEKKYLFIDGAYIREELDSISAKYFDNESISLEIRQLNQGYVKTFYYDCLPHKKRNESDSDFANRLKKAENEFNRIRQCPGSHVILGKTSGKIGRVRQKQVDVRIAVDMLSHAYNKNMFACTLITGDQDFTPVVQAIVLAGAYVSICCFKDSASKVLLDAADSRSFLSLQDVMKFVSHDCQQKWGIPEFSGGVGKRYPGMKLVRSGKLESGDEVELYIHKNGQVSITNFIPDENRHCRISTRNESFTMKLVEEKWGTISWTSEPEEES